MIRNDQESAHSFCSSNVVHSGQRFSNDHQILSNLSDSIMAESVHVKERVSCLLVRVLEVRLVARIPILIYYAVPHIRDHMMQNDGRSNLRRLVQHFVSCRSLELLDAQVL